MTMLKKHQKGESVVCVNNKGYQASLELRKIYEAIPDTGAARHHLLRVIDDSGEDYLYPKSFFFRSNCLRPTRGYFLRPPDARIRAVSLSTVNCRLLAVDCQLSTVNCQL